MKNEISSKRDAELTDNIKQTSGRKTPANPVLTLRQRKALVELLFTPGALELDGETMEGAWR